MARRSLQERSRLILGLGNPGPEYRETRHNLGFVVADHLARSLGIASRTLECNALVADAKGVTVAWPQTYMNRSGHAVRCLIERRGLVPEDLLVVYDDTSLPLGVLRMRTKGGPGGHRGMESVIRAVRSESIARLRLGISPGDGDDSEIRDLTAFVLEPFSADESRVVEQMVRRAAEACRSWLDEGAETTMNRFNG